MNTNQQCAIHKHLLATGHSFQKPVHSILTCNNLQVQQDFDAIYLQLLSLKNIAVLHYII